MAVRLRGTRAASMRTRCRRSGGGGGSGVRRKESVNGVNRTAGRCEASRCESGRRFEMVKALHGGRRSACMQCAGRCACGSCRSGNCCCCSAVAVRVSAARVHGAGVASLGSSEWMSARPGGRVRAVTTVANAGKTRKSAAKRFRMTGSGKVVFMRSTRAHNLELKSSRRKRRLTGMKVVRIANIKGVLSTCERTRTHTHTHTHMPSYIYIYI